MSRWAERINQMALFVAVGCFAALGVWWAWDRTRPHEPPAWPDARFASLEPASEPSGRKWIVIVNPTCPHCRARLADLGRRGAARADSAALGVLVVDTPHRPDTLALGTELGAGLWWDSLGVWRSRWRHGLYGEALVFDASGHLERVVLPADDSVIVLRH